MMDDFRQDKQDQPLDPLSEGTSLPWGKKIGLVCLGVAVIGLFIFFTSDSWSSDSKKSGNEELAADIEQIKIRLTDLEQHNAGRPLAQAEMPSIADASAQDMPTSDGPAMANLKSLIEQELQETAAEPQQPVAKAETPAAQPAKKPVAKADGKQQMYTVKKGDTLSKIAQQFYGSSKKWRRIVDANKDKLGQSQVLKAGMTLVIPKDA
jgi:nucleoid-associated protein YgaU